MKKAKYPKTLPWKAAKHNVEEDQAKIAWGQTMLLTKILMAEEDFEFQNEQFDTRLKVLGFINDMLARTLTLTVKQKIALERGE